MRQTLADALRLGVAAVAGAVFALILYQLWDLELRWMIVVIIGIVAVAAAMALARVFSDFLIISGLFILPLASFDKWFWPVGYDDNDRGNLVYAGLFGIGLLDFIVIGLYLSWFYGVFVVRNRPPLRLINTDWFVLGYIGAHLLATASAEDKLIGLAATEYLLKYVLFYLYLSRNLQAKHIPWLLAAIAFAITLEAVLGSIQFSSGKLLGIALDKGAGSSEAEYQYSVPGLEHATRATGTSYDSHSLGNVMAMLLPFPFVLCLTPKITPPARFFSIAFALAAVMVVIFTLSRAAWVSTALAVVLAIALIVFVWRERQALPLLIGGAMATASALPLVGGFIYNRFANSPNEVLTTRFDQYVVALDVIRSSPFVGYGPGNWVKTLAKKDFLWLEVLPPHDVALWIWAETGIIGLCFYVAIITSAVVRLIRLITTRRDLAGRLGMATLVAIATTIMVGLTDPTYREPNVFALFWVLIALSVALPRMPPLPTARILSGAGIAMPWAVRPMQRLGER